MIGQTLDGRYRVLRQLGEGGMGEVFLVEHINLARQEALKVLKATLATVPQFVSRFRREARATNRVQHPHIVSVYDFGQLPDGRYFLSMEYADGERLDKLLNRLGPLPVSRALTILAQLAEAIDHAHAHGVVHRDLKPDNLVLIEYRGRQDYLKILDFGIAKIVAPDYQESQALSNKDETMGTPAYMSPEQFAGVGDEPRSDIYAIGCIGFEILVGEPPFSGRVMQLMHAHLTKQPDRPSARRPSSSIPVLLDDIILRCLAKDPVRRYQTGAELLVALEQVPGWKKYRSGRRRTRPSAPAQLSAVSDFGEDATDVHDEPDLATLDEERSLRAADGMAETLQLSLEEVRLALSEAMCELAETILDAGHHDIQLVVGVANLQQLDADLARLDAEQLALESRGQEIEQAARERQGALRFALGELYYERGQMERAGKPSPDLANQMRSLEERINRITQDLERDLSQITEKGIDLASARSAIEEKRASMRRSVTALCDEVTPNFYHHPVVQPQLTRVRSLRETIAALELTEKRRRK